MNPLVLNKADVIANAAKAYQENRLQMQHPETGERRCRYRSREFCCVIGASIPDDKAVYFDSLLGSGINTLVYDGHVVTDDLPFLNRLQLAHDHVVAGQVRYADKVRQMLGV
jgi:hypothetical protein